MKKYYLILILFGASSMLPGCSKKSSDTTTLPDKGTFTIAGAVYSGPTIATIYNGALEVDITDNGGEEMVVYNMPSSTNGSFDVYNTFETGVLQSSTEVYATSTILIANLTGGSVSVSGTLTKTGARSFTLTGIFRASLSPGSTATVSATGNY